MFCKNCGKEIDDNAAICIHCGVATDNLIKPNQNKTQKSDKGVNGFAIAGLVLAIVGLFGGNYLFLVPSAVGLALSIVAMVKAKQYSLEGLAIAALVVSIISFFIWLIIWVAAFTVIAAVFGWTTHPVMSIISL